MEGEEKADKGQGRPFEGGRQRWIAKGIAEKFSEKTLPMIRVSVDKRFCDDGDKQDTLVATAKEDEQDNARRKA